MGFVKVLALIVCIDLTAAQFAQTTTTAASLPAQCVQYNTIDDRTRHVNAQGDDQCDTMFMSGSTWIRFVGESGTELATSPMNSNQCGSRVAGWYAGAKPSTYQTVTNGRVCFSWLNNSCHWANSIAVTNCGSFHVYQLTMPPVCPARYCTETPYVPTTATTTSTSTSTPPLFAPQCYNHTTIDDPTRGVSQGINTVCDQSVFSSGPMWVRFVGVGGTQIPTSAVEQKRCNTYATGWYAGAMPTSLYESENGNVCFAYESNTCRWAQNISVTNCGSYYIYQLSAPPVCNLRYCTDTPSMVTTTTTEMTTMTTSTSWYSHQCYAHRVIDDPTRNVNFTTSNNQCDNTVFNTTGEWVRFTGTGGTRIPTSAPQPTHCGAHAGGWYSGIMPDALYTTTNGTVCFSWFGNTCTWNNTIQVTNCGSFYVYRLTQPSSCTLRYCTDTPSAPTTHTTTTTEMTTSTSMDSPQCRDHTVIDDPTRHVNSTVSGNQCDQNVFNATGVWVRFTGTGGTQMPTTATQPNQCGTHASGWYSGTMPNATYTTTNGSVCFSYSGNPCNWNNNIHVTNCGSFFVYRLTRPSGCSFRYCTAHSSGSRSTSTPAGAFTSIFKYFRSLFTKLREW